MHPPVVDPLTHHDNRAGYEFEQPKRGRGPCTARCGVTGLRCKLPQHDAKTQHASERGPFRVVAVPGQTTFAAAELRDRMATAQAGGVDPVLALQEGL